MYFQRQHGLQCTLHAANNAIGAKVLIAADLNKAADELVLAMATRSQEAQRCASTRKPEELGSLQARCRRALVGPAGGQWSADCARLALAKKGCAPTLGSGLRLQGGLDRTGGQVSPCRQAVRACGGHASSTWG
jgi:hypothetical protein